MFQQDNNYFVSRDNFSSAYNCNGIQPSYVANSSQCKPFLARIIHSNNEKKAVDNSNTFSQQHELSNLELNDVVTILDKLDNNWFLAKFDKEEGRLNVQTCQILDDTIPSQLCQYLIDNQFFNLHVCFASFVAQDVGDLSITRGDIIVANEQVNEHWIKGQVCFDSQMNCWPKLVISQQIGTIPINHCWQLDSERVEEFCKDKVRPQQQLSLRQHLTLPSKPPFILTAHSSSLSSGSSSLHSSDYQHSKTLSRAEQPPRQPSLFPPQQEHAESQVKPASLLSNRQQDKLKGWLHTMKKKTARLSTRITASLGLISLTRDEEFEKHYERFKHIEKTLKSFIKNLTAFVEHFENFLLALQNTSENLSDFYRDKSHHQKELEELRKKNKVIACEHFHAFKRTIDRQVVSVTSQLLQKFSGPHQLINKRSTKLLDYDTKTKEMESCRDLEKKASLREQYVIAKDIYDRINRQLIEELPLFNQFSINIFRDCILVLLESRRNLILSYTNQTASLLDTPLMLTYTASNVASSILMSCDLTKNSQLKKNNEFNQQIEQDRKDGGQTSGHDTRHTSGNEDETSRPHSSASQLSSEFNQMAQAAREISSTPLSQVSEFEHDVTQSVDKFDELDGEQKDLVNEIINSTRKVEIINSDDGSEPLKQPQPVPKKEEMKRKKKKFQIYLASWPFVATGPNQLSITCKQPLKLIKGCDECGNSDWSLVQDKKGQLGYVPSSYIKKKE